MTKYVLIVAVERKEFTTYGLLNKDSYDAWNNGHVEVEGLPDHFSLMTTGFAQCDTFSTYEEVSEYLKAHAGEIADIVGALAY